MYLNKLLDLAITGIPYYTDIFTSQLKNPINAVITANNLTLTYSQPLPDWFISYAEANSFITIYNAFFDITFTNFTIMNIVHSLDARQKSIQRIFFAVDVINSIDFKSFDKCINKAFKLKSVDINYNNQFVILHNIINNTLIFYIEVESNTPALTNITHLLFNYNKTTSGVNGKHNIVSLTTNSITYKIDDNFNFNTGYSLYLDDIVLHYAHYIICGDNLIDQNFFNTNRRPVLVIKPGSLRPQDVGTSYTDNNSPDSSVQYTTETQEIFMYINIPANKKYNDELFFRADVEYIYNELIHKIKYLLRGVKFQVDETYLRLSSGLSFKGATQLDTSDLQMAIGVITFEFNVKSTKVISSIIDEDRELHKILGIDINYSNQYNN